MKNTPSVIRHPANSPFAAPELARCPANFQPLTPLSFLQRAAHINGEMPAFIHGERTLTWRETHQRAVRLGRALCANGIAPGDVVAIVASNTPEFNEAMFGVPMMGAIINPINVRLDADTIAFILQHGKARAVLVDREFSDTVHRALQQANLSPLLITINDPVYTEKSTSPEGVDYEAFLQQGDETPFPPPADEWQALSLNYTSGTTGNPKGAVYSHRGAWMTAMGNITAWQMPRYAPYIWTLPMFHCCGWCFPWTVAALAGVNIGMRKVSVDSITAGIEAGGAWLCGAPIVLNTLLQSIEQKPIQRPVHFMVAAAPPPAAILDRANSMGVQVLHAYGLTEIYGPGVACDWKPAWDELTDEERSNRRSRQGAPYLTLDSLSIADGETAEAMPADGETMGEVMMRGNGVMMGYYKNPQATAAAFAEGWFHSGDLGVMEADNYIRLKDRAKDVIISGGENISSIEVEDVLCRHPAVAAAAVIAKPHEKWGETPLAYVELNADSAATAAEIIAHCRAQMAHFKCPTEVRFGVIPRTVTGKVQKFRLRESNEK